MTVDFLFGKRTSLPNAVYSALSINQLLQIPVTPNTGTAAQRPLKHPTHPTHRPALAFDQLRLQGSTEEIPLLLQTERMILG